MLSFATDGMLSFSTTPLQFSITLGTIFALIALIFICYTLILRIFTQIQKKLPSVTL